MKVKRFEASTLQEALLNVKRDLGSDAVILQTRKLNRGGMFGFMRKDYVEVLAATDINTAGSQSSPDKKAAAPEKKNNTSLISERLRRPAASSAKTARPGEGDVKDELREVKESLRALLQQRQSPTVERVKPFSQVFGDIYMRLIENEVDDSVAKDIVRSLDESMPEDEKNEEELVYVGLAKVLRRLIKVSGAINISRGAPRTVAFVGPTGVGKTTTIAKLATTVALSNRKKVGIITADTFRIAAVEQIKVYGEILNVPIRVVYNGEDMKYALDYFSDRDLILIDTAGRSHWDGDRINELRDLLSACYPLEIHLAVSANTRYRDMLDIADRFRPLAYNHFVFTKLDETSTYGCLINLITKCNVGVSYLCYGQNVPGEIQEASVETLMSLTIGEPLSKVVRAGREA